MWAGPVLVFVSVLGRVTTLERRSDPILSSILSFQNQPCPPRMDVPVLSRGLPRCLERGGGYSGQRLGTGPSGFCKGTATQHPPECAFTV